MAANRYAKLQLEASQGNESGPGDLMDAEFFLPSEEIEFPPGPNMLDRSNELRGIDGRVIGAPNEIEPSGRVQMRAYTHYLGALLTLLFGDVSTTPGAGGGTPDPDGNPVPVGAYIHRFRKKTGVDPLTAQATLQYGAGGPWLRARGVSATSAAFTIADDGVRVESNLMANYVARLSVDPAETVDQEDFAVLPFRRRNVQVTFPDLGSSAKLQDFNFSLEQTLEYVRDMGVASAYPSATERANSPEGFLRMQGALTRRSFAPQDWDALIASSVFEIRCRMQSEQHIGVTSYPYSMWAITDKAQYTGGGPEALKQQARHEASYDWQAGSDDPDVNDFEVYLVTGDASYKANTVVS